MRGLITGFRAKLAGLSCVTLASFLLGGCVEPFGTRQATRMVEPVRAFDERSGDPVALSTVRVVAVFPFDNLSAQDSFDSMSFATKFANQLGSHGRTQVIFPREVMNVTARMNKRIKDRNDELYKLTLLGKKPEKQIIDEEVDANALPEAVNREMPLLDPIRNRNDAVKIGRMMDADAVIIGAVTDFDPYYRPRMAVSLKAITTGRSETAAQELIQLTQWGVARNSGRANGLAWFRQQIFDTRDGGTARELYLFARNHHTEDRPFDTEIYMRVMERFYEFVGGTLADKLLLAKDTAAHEALERARKATEKAKKERERLMAQVKALVQPTVALPSEEEIARKNIYDRRDRSWRAEDYGAAHPESVNNTVPEPITGGQVVGP